VWGKGAPGVGIVATFRLYYIIILLIIINPPPKFSTILPKFKEKPYSSTSSSSPSSSRPSNSISGGIKLEQCLLLIQCFKQERFLIVESPKRVRSQLITLLVLEKILSGSSDIGGIEYISLAR